MGISQEEAYEILELPNGTSVSTAIKSYKRLSLEWFPDKHDNSPTSLEKFQKISQAILKLVLPQQDVSNSMTQIDMLSLFQQIFFGSEKHIFKSGDSEIWDDEAFSSDNDFLDDLSYGSDIDRNDSEDDEYNGFERTVSAQEAAKNAEALIEEEEKEKKKAEKRRAKKKRRKEKRKLEKASEKQSENSNDGCHKLTSSSTNEVQRRIPDTKESSVDSEEDIDTNSAFVAVVARKTKKMLNQKEKDQKDLASQKCAPGKENIHNFIIEGHETNSTILRSRQLAIRGNEMANVGCYQEAVDLFSEAIKLNPTDHRYYGNRSYCYDRLNQYQRALKDAEKSIGLSPTWPKSYFRKGRALAGLKQYASAEKSFEEVLKFDKGSEDAVSELAKVRVLQVTEMGFPSSVAEAAIAKYGNVQTVLDILLSGATSKLTVNRDPEVFVSDSDSEPGDWLSTISIPSHLQLHPQSQPLSVDKKMDPHNPEGHTSVWVGNVKPEVTDKAIISMFSRCGELLSVRLLPEKFCAFVNFKDKVGAGRAMKTLQGYELLGVNLLIRFPDNSGKTGTGTVLKKTKPGITQDASKPKVLGPVNGDECYFWRTTGCLYSGTCRFKHIKENKGVDMKNWHTKTS